MHYKFAMLPPMLIRPLSLDYSISHMDKTAGLPYDVDADDVFALSQKHFSKVRLVKYKGWWT